MRRADRCDPQQLRRALDGREFDAVIDTTLYRGKEAHEIVDLLQGRIGRFIFISTGQVYRRGLRCDTWTCATSWPR